MKNMFPSQKSSFQQERESGRKPEQKKQELPQLNQERFKDTYQSILLEIHKTQEKIIEDIQNFLDFSLQHAEQYELSLLGDGNIVFDVVEKNDCPSHTVWAHSLDPRELLDKYISFLKNEPTLAILAHNFYLYDSNNTKKHAVVRVQNKYAKAASEVAPDLAA